MSSLPLLMLVLAAAPEWHDSGTVDGLHVALRDVLGSPFPEIRVTGRSHQSLGSLCDAIFDKGHKVDEKGFHKRFEVLRETDTDRWTYERISLPVVADRDYVLHVRLLRPASSGSCEVSFETDSSFQRPLTPGCVRIGNIQGRWALRPTADGWVEISYRVYSDPGGGVPAFLARGGQRRAALDFFKAIVSRAAAPR